LLSIGAGIAMIAGAAQPAHPFGEQVIDIIPDSFHRAEAVPKCIPLKKAAVMLYNRFQSQQLEPNDSLVQNEPAYSCSGFIL
jgi:hypothetical protein